LVNLITERREHMKFIRAEIIPCLKAGKELPDFSPDCFICKKPLTYNQLVYSIENNIEDVFCEECATKLYGLFPEHLNNPKDVQVDNSSMYETIEDMYDGICLKVCSLGERVRCPTFRKLFFDGVAFSDVGFNVICSNYCEFREKYHHPDLGCITEEDDEEVCPYVDAREACEE